MVNTRKPPTQPIASTEGLFGMGPRDPIFSSASGLLPVRTSATVLSSSQREFECTMKSVKAELLIQSCFIHTSALQNKLEESLHPKGLPILGAFK